jgi:DNA-binding transcriptional regulator PaaX
VGRTPWLHPQIYRLEEQALVEKEKDRTMGRLVRLTEKGRRKLTVVMNPADYWSLKWNGQWEIIFFDIPETERTLRNTLRKKLRAEKFGPLQQSVWLRPDPGRMSGMQKIDKTTAPGVFQLGKATFSKRDERGIVERAWNWEQIKDVQRSYHDHLEHVDTLAGREKAKKMFITGF